MNSGKDERDRCRHCRYWSERCCHALAMMEGRDRDPVACHHYLTEHARLFRPGESQAG